MSKLGADFKKTNIAHLKIIQTKQRLKIFHYLLACKQDSVLSKQLKTCFLICFTVQKNIHAVMEFNFVTFLGS